MVYNNSILPEGHKRPTDPGFSICDSRQEAYFENLVQSIPKILIGRSDMGISIEGPLISIIPPSRIRLASLNPRPGATIKEQILQSKESLAPVKTSVKRKRS